MRKCPPPILNGSPIFIYYHKMCRYWLFADTNYYTNAKDLIGQYNAIQAIIGHYNVVMDRIATTSNVRSNGYTQYTVHRE